MQLVPDPPGVITEGEIYFKGQNLILNTDKENEKIRGNGISMIFQDPMTALNPTMTIGDQLIEVLRRHNKMSKDMFLLTLTWDPMHPGVRRPGS